MPTWRGATAEVFLDAAARARASRKPNPRPMFPNPPGLLRLEPHSEGLRERIWWGAGTNATAEWAAKLGMNLQSSTLKIDETGEPFHVQQAEQIRTFRAAWKEAGHAREPRVSVSRSIFALIDDRDRDVFRRRRARARTRSASSSEKERAIFGRSYAAEPDVLIEQLKAGRGDRRGRHAAADGAEPARRRLQRPCHRGDPEACRAGTGLALFHRFNDIAPAYESCCGAERNDPFCSFCVVSGYAGTLKRTAHRVAWTCTRFRPSVTCGFSPGRRNVEIAPRACNVLLVYPRFAGETFWNFAAACEIFGARYPTSPLGLITVAAMLPSSWNLRLLDRNVEDLTDSDLGWADLVMTGGMLPQHDDLLEIIESVPRARQAGRHRRAGATSVPHFYAKANFQVLGEVEDVIDDFIAAWEGGAREGVFTGQEIRDRCAQDPDPALRSPEVRSLSLCRRAVLARLSVHLRILRHHRAVRPGAAHQVHAADAGGARCALRARLSRACRFRRRQSDRQQEGGEGVPAATSRHGSKRTIIRSSSPPRPRSISPTTTNCCG